MTITRNNYEEFFILYMDNELGSDDRRQVELFVKENPDLQEELNLLMQTQLAPNNSFVFAGKEQLLKTPGSVPIDTSDYEEWLLSYTDNELSAEQKIAVERFIAGHPAAKAELELLLKTKLQPEAAIIFANKEILYRREEKVKIIGIRWRRIAVAAGLLLAVSTAALLAINNNKDSREDIASGNIEQKKNTQEIPVVEQPGVETVLINPPTNDNTTGKKETGQISNSLAKEKKRVQQKQNPAPYLPVEVKQNDAVIADNIDKKNRNNLPQPVHNPNVNRNTERDNPIAKMDPAVDPLTNIKETNRIPSVTPNSAQPLDNVVTAASKVSVDPVDEERPGRKNKLRGFFRKVTRTFEKNTNIKATDDEDRLLLGGLAIKL